MSNFQNSFLYGLFNVALKTNRERWTIETGGGNGSGRSVLLARHDDDDFNFLLFYIELLA